MIGGIGFICDGDIRDVATLVDWAGFSVLQAMDHAAWAGFGEPGSGELPMVIDTCIVSPGDLLIGEVDGLVALSPAAICGRIADAEAKLAAGERLGEEPRLAAFGAEDL